MNIGIINYCNLHCPYCFANKFIESEKQIITEDQLDSILDFLLKPPKTFKGRIGIIGGEPTLHPNFADIVNKVSLFSKVHNIEAPLVFSNGILLGEYSKLFEENRCLINLNNPITIGDSKWNDLEKSLMILEYDKTIKNITFGINLYHNMPDYSFIFNVLKDFSKDKIRCSFVAPTNNNMNKDEYYNSGKELFLNFVKDAEKNKISLQLDCNQIPLCYFTEKEKELIICNTNNRTPWCHPVIDVTPNLQISSCFGCYNEEKLINLLDFDNYQELERYFEMNHIYPMTLKNNDGKCSQCKKFAQKICQGGCLAFAKNKKD